MEGGKKKMGRARGLGHARYTQFWGSRAFWRDAPPQKHMNHRPLSPPHSRRNSSVPPRKERRPVIRESQDFLYAKVGTLSRSTLHLSTSLYTDWDAQKTFCSGRRSFSPRSPPLLFSLTPSFVDAVVREESRHREKKGGSQVTARAGERERRRYSM